MNKYPEHDRLAAVSAKSQAIGDFIEWLNQEKGAHLMICRTIEGRDERFFLPGSREEWLAEFFEIDLAAIQREKEQMLNEIRALQQAREGA